MFICELVFITQPSNFGLFCANKMAPVVSEGILRAENGFSFSFKKFEMANPILRLSNLINFYKPGTPYWIRHFEFFKSE